LSNIVEEGRRFTSASDLNVADMKQEAPVGTTGNSGTHDESNECDPSEAPCLDATGI